MDTTDFNGIFSRMNEKEPIVAHSKPYFVHVL